MTEKVFHESITRQKKRERERGGPLPTSGTALRRVEGSQSREGSRGGQKGCETRTRPEQPGQCVCVKGGQEEYKKKEEEKEKRSKRKEEEKDRGKERMQKVERSEASTYVL